MKVNEFRLRLYPEDFETEKAFYEEVLGFKIKHYWDREESKGVMFDVGGTTLELLWPQEDKSADMATGSGLSLAVEDVAGLFESIKDAAKVAHGLRHNSWGDTSFRIESPGGYKISFFTPDSE